VAWNFDKGLASTFFCPHPMLTIVSGHLLLHWFLFSKSGEEFLPPQMLILSGHLSLTWAAIFYHFSLKIFYAYQQ
jgi:hypothetical protein